MEHIQVMKGLQENTTDGPLGIACVGAICGGACAGGGCFYGAVGLACGFMC